MMQSSVFFGPLLSPDGERHLRSMANGTCGAAPPPGSASDRARNISARGLAPRTLKLDWGVRTSVLAHSHWSVIASRASHNATVAAKPKLPSSVPVQTLHQPPKVEDGQKNREASYGEAQGHILKTITISEGSDCSATLPCNAALRCIWSPGAALRSC